MSLLVNRKFREWTEGLDPHQSRISIFEHIRDIPYSLDLPPQGSSAIEQLLSDWQGACGAKHYLLADMFRRLDLAVVFATFAFSWNDPEIRYPPPLRGLVARLPVIHHLACRVRIGCRWVLVDATWDPPLAKAGFPVNLNWDGYADTRCAVKPMPSPVRTAFCRTATNAPCRSGAEAELCPLDGETDYRDEEEHAELSSGKRALRSPDDIVLIRQFNQEFSDWLKTLRT